MLEHQSITKYNQKGYLGREVEHEILFTDELNKPVFKGDKVYQFKGLVFKMDGLKDGAIEVLESIGADLRKV